MALNQPSDFMQARLNGQGINIHGEISQGRVNNILDIKVLAPPFFSPKYTTLGRILWTFRWYHQYNNSFSAVISTNSIIYPPMVISSFDSLLKLSSFCLRGSPRQHTNRSSPTLQTSAYLRLCSEQNTMKM